MYKVYDINSSNESFYIEHEKTASQAVMEKEHLHSAWEFYFYLGDSMTYFVKDASYVVKKYDLVFIDRHTYHKTTYKSKERGRILVYLRDGLFSLFGDKKPLYDYLLNISKFVVLSFDESSKKMVYEKFIKIAKLYEENREDTSKLQIFFADLLATINLLIENGRVTAGMKNKDKNSVIVSQITNYINNNYSEKITLDFLAEKFFVDKYHMCHIFRKETGITIVDFINQKRITQAGILLKGTNKSVNEISTLVGFPNQNYFGVVFKKQYGKSPREFKMEK